jgi:hypothetical protein
MAKRFLAGFLTLGLMVGGAGLVGCGEGEKTTGYTPEEAAARRAATQANSGKAAETPATTTATAPK